MIKHVVAILIVMSVLVSQVGAAVGERFDREALLQECDAVAVVKILGPEELDRPSEPDQWRGIIRVSVRQILHGSNLPPVIDLVWAGGFRGFEKNPMRASSTYIAFVSRMSERNAWRVVSPWAMIPIGDSVAVDTGRGGLWSAIRQALSSSLSFDNTESQSRVLEALAKIDEREDPVAIDAARLLSSSDDPALAARALAYRFAMGDPASLEQARALIEEPGRLNENDAYLLANHAIWWNENVEVSTLNQILATSSSPVARHRAVLALLPRGDESSIPMLVGALTDDDPKIRSKAHRALLRITGRKLPVEFEEFAGRVEDPVAEWTAWLNSRGQ